MTACPECDATLSMKDQIEGEILTCPDCGAELEVTSVEPFNVSLAPREQEDWGE